MSRYPTLATTCVLLACFAIAQNQPSKSADAKSSQAPTTTIRSNSRLVVVDVLVNTSDGKPIRDLKKQDFTISEDAKPQTISAFEEYRSDGAAPRRAVKINLPPNTYTNYVAAPSDGTVNILLLDTLNSENKDLTFARQRMIELLRKLPPGKRVALYTLSMRLEMVQNFTADTDTLVTAAQELSPRTHPVYSNHKQMESDVAQMKEGGLAKSPKLLAHTIQFREGEQSVKADMRTEYTLDALNELARSMAVIPGRKNLIWISGGFPFTTFRASDLEKTASLLASTQMAVYPVDLRGTIVGLPTGETNSTEIFSPMAAAAPWIAGESDEIVNTRDPMYMLARETGGKALMNSNTLDNSIAQAMESGSNYYVLAYRPANTNWNGKFRKITVKLTDNKARLLYRPGYFATPDQPQRDDAHDRAFFDAMQPYSLPSTTLVIQARVVSPEQAGKPVVLDYLVDLHDLVLTEGADQKRVPNVEFAAVAWDGQGHDGGSFSQIFRQPLDASELQRLMKGGLQLHWQLPVKPGTYQLRLGVLDKNSGKIASLDVPLKVEGIDAARAEAPRQK